MSTILQQLKKKLTFEEICPQWASEIPKRRYDGKEWFGSQEKGLDINNYKCCIVGEAHGFSYDYIRRNNPNSCEVCANLSDELVHRIGIDEKIERFTQHWNEVHLNK